MCILVFVLERVMITADINITGTITNLEKDSLFLVEWSIIISPLTTRFFTLGRSETRSCVKANVLTREGQKPWNVSAFSHQVCRRISSALRPSISIDSRSVSTVSLWLLMRKAKGITRDWRKVAVLAVVMREAIARNKSARTGRIDSPAFLSRWIIRSPICSPPDSS